MRIGEKKEKKTALLCSPEFCPQILWPSGSNKYSLRHLVEVVTGIPTPLVCTGNFFEEWNEITLQIHIRKGLLRLVLADTDTDQWD